ncbi:MAG: PilZ domain-containing protein [Polyangia bacterium]
MTSETRDNRRNFDRFPFSARLEVRVGRRSGHRAPLDPAIDLMSADAFDVSVSGFGFRSPLPLAVGDVIAVTLAELRLVDDGTSLAGAHDDPDLEIRAVVRHIRPDATDGRWVVGAERAG